MSVQVAVFLGIGLLAVLAFVRGFTAQKWPSPRQIAGLWIAGLFLLLIGRASPQLAKGLTLLMVLAVFLTEGGIPGISVLGKTSTPAKPAPNLPSDVPPDLAPTS